jgi:hypothetical protein
LTINIEMNMNMHINIERWAPRGGFAPKPPRLRRDRIFSDATSPKKRCDAPPKGTRVTQTLPKNKAMRFHPQSPFGKAWAAHFKAANLARLSDEEKRVEYNRFSAEWAPVHGPDAHR